MLPTSVQNQGITIRKRTPDILLIVSLFSPDGRYDDLYLSNFAMIHIRDELLRVDGVSDVIIFGERDYSIRVWLDPQKMAAYGHQRRRRGGRHRQPESSTRRPGRSANRRPPRVSPSRCPSTPWAGSSTPEQFGDIIVKVDRGTRRSAFHCIVGARGQ